MLRSKGPINKSLELVEESTLRKAKKLVESGNVEKIEDGLYLIRSSSDPEKSYFVTFDTCECPGFKNFYKFRVYCIILVIHTFVTSSVIGNTKFYKNSICNIYFVQLSHLCNKHQILPWQETKSQLLTFGGSTNIHAKF